MGEKIGEKVKQEVILYILDVSNMNLIAFIYSVFKKFLKLIFRHPKLMQG